MKEKILSVLVFVNILMTKCFGIGSANPFFWLRNKVIEIVDKRKADNVINRLFNFIQQEINLIRILDQKKGLCSIVDRCRR